MIRKITKLQGVGTLHAPLTASGALTFKQKVILFGENGRGKTTLVALLRSLATGDVSSLHQRKSIKGVHPQSAQILIDQQPHDLIDGRWSKLHPNIAVFDSRFIDENVYTGAGVNSDHRKNLLSFALGPEGVKLAHKIEELATEITNHRRIEFDAKAQVQAHIKGNLRPETFLTLDPIDGDRQTEIETQKQKVDAIRRASIIQRLQTLSPISFDEFPLAALNELLDRTLENLSRTVEAQFKAHLDRTHASEEWIATGTHFNSGDRCPYCAQELVHSQIAQVYGTYFSAEYHNYKEALREHLGQFEQILSPQKQANLRNAVDNNRSRLLQWAEFIPEASLNFDIPTASTAIEAARAALGAAARRKLASPLEKAALSSDELSSVRAVDAIVTAVDEYNASAVTINETILKLRDSIQAGNLAQAESELLLLQNRVARYTEEAKESCDLWNEAIKKHRELEGEKAEARKELDEFTASVLSKYQDAINQHLKRCGTFFRISALKTNYQGGSPRCEYGIELFGQSVDLANKPASPIIFDSALSQGDKNALAFAFFLAQLESDPKRSEKIIIFDDPLSSLDTSRRRYTRKMIADLSNEVAQVIVLTHEEATVADISGRFGEDECSIFELRPQGNYSIFTSATAKEITANEYAKYFSSLTHYHIYGDGRPQDIVKNVRPYLEANLRYRFPEEFLATDSLGKMIKQIRSAPPGKPLARMAPVLSELENINDFCIEHSHGDGALQNKESISDSELKPIVGSALEISRGFPSTV